MLKKHPPLPCLFSKARISVMNRLEKLSSLEFGELIFHSHKSITIITHSGKKGLKLQTLRQVALHYIHTYVVPWGHSAVLCKQRCQFQHRYSHYHLDLPPGGTGGRGRSFQNDILKTVGPLGMFSWSAICRQWETKDFCGINTHVPCHAQTAV